MKTDFIRKRPLFYGAILLASVIFLNEYVFSGFFSHGGAKNLNSKQIALDNQEVFLGGVIVSEVDEKINYEVSNVSFILNARRLWVDKKPVEYRKKVKVYLKNPSQYLSYGDEVVLEGRLAEPDERRNPGGFDQKAYLANSRITKLFFSDKKDEIKLLKSHQGLWLKEVSLKSRRLLSEAIGTYFHGESEGFLKALFLGERNGLDEDFKDLFIKTGTMHILAVSGFNIGFLSFSIFLILKLFRVPRNISYLIVLGGIWAYCLIVGWQAPVVRASIMASLFVVGRLVGRGPDLLNLMGASALVILLVNSKQLFDVGFQLSYLAVLSIAIFLPRFVQAPKLLPNEKWLFKEKLAHYFNELFWISFVCLFVTLPVTVQNFYIVAPFSLIANLVVVPLSFLLFFTGFIFFLTYGWIPKFLFFLPWLMTCMMKVFTRSLFFIENLPGAYWIVGKLDPVLWALLTAGIFYLLVTRHLARPFVRALIIFIFVSDIFLLQEAVRRFDDKLRMTVLDVGQGDAIFFEFPHGSNLLIDAGKGRAGDRGKYVIAPFLKSKGISTVDVLAISHPQEDHIGGMLSVLREFEVKNVIHAGSNYPTALYKHLKHKITDEKASVYIAREGDRIAGFSDADISVLNPPRGRQSKNINNDSLVLKIAYKNTRFLLTGDIEEEAMTYIRKEHDLRSDVIKIPHHGARLLAGGKAFVEQTMPKFSAISVGRRNPFGHPSPVTLSVLNSLPQNRVLRTDLDHAIQFVSDGQLV